MTAMTRRPEHIDDAERDRVRQSTNDRVSHACIAVALIICVFCFALTVLGAQDIRNVMLGVILSVILLAIALLQDRSKR
jgi:Flp pilus assembly protein TadB